jgi:hypothetical protein
MSLWMNLFAFDLGLILAKHIFTLVSFGMVEGEEIFYFLQWNGLQRTLIVM